MMMENYRSTPEILAAANSLIAKNGHRIKKDLLPTKPSGEKVVCHFADTQEAEAQWMAGEMQRLHDRGVPLRDMTVALPRALCDARGGRGVDARKKFPIRSTPACSFLTAWRSRTRFRTCA